MFVTLFIEVYLISENTSIIKKRKDKLRNISEFSVLLSMIFLLYLASTLKEAVFTQNEIHFFQEKIFYIVNSIAIITRGYYFIRYREQSALIDFISLILFMPFIYSIEIVSDNFILVLAFSLVFSNKIYQLYELIKTKNDYLSRNSIKEAVDHMKVGIMFAETSGVIVLRNSKFFEISNAIFAETVLNAVDFIEALKKHPNSEIYESLGIILFRTDDDITYRISTKKIKIKSDDMYEILISDVSETLDEIRLIIDRTVDLNCENKRLKKELEQIHKLSRESELKRIKINLHDSFGHRISLFQSAIKREKPDYNALSTIMNGMLSDLKPNTKLSPFYKLEELVITFANFGVEISVDGDLPKEMHLADNIVDIFKEATTNAIVHGKSKKIKLEINQEISYYSIVISNVLSRRLESITEGSGLGFIRNRISQLNGKMDIQYGNAFVLNIRLPYS